MSTEKLHSRPVLAGPAYETRPLRAAATPARACAVVRDRISSLAYRGLPYAADASAPSADERTERVGLFQDSALIGCLLINHAYSTAESSGAGVTTLWVTDFAARRRCVHRTASAPRARSRPPRHHKRHRGPHPAGECIMTPQPSGTVRSPQSTGVHARPERTSADFPPAYGLVVPGTPAPAPAPAPAAVEARAERRLYIAPYRDEAPSNVEVIFDADGRVCYADERPGDRCVDGWLWERWEGTETGGQLWAGHHPVRQPDVMRHPPRCGGCAGKAHRDKRGMLWLLHATEHTPRTWPCDITTVTPPMCLDDARWALHACRADGGFIAVRTRNVEIIGVRGTVYSPSQPPQVDTLVLFHDSRMHQVVANRLVIRLHDAELDETTLSLHGADGHRGRALEGAAGPPR